MSGCVDIIAIGVDLLLFFLSIQIMIDNSSVKVGE
jgi:hypothetical protein